MSAWLRKHLQLTYVVGYSDRRKIGKQSDEDDEIGTDSFVENDHLLRLAAVEWHDTFREHLPRSPSRSPSECKERYGIGCTTSYAGRSGEPS
jgi:hypothetical protein